MFNIDMNNPDDVFISECFKEVPGLGVYQRFNSYSMQEDKILKVWQIAFISPCMQDINFLLLKEIDNKLKQKDICISSVAMLNNQLLIILVK